MVRPPRAPAESVNPQTLAYPQDHSGDVSHTEFREGLAMLGFHMTDDEFKKFVQAYDTSTACRLGCL